MNRARRLLIVFILLLGLGVGLFLVARSQEGKVFVDSDQVHQQGGTTVALNPGHNVGQTFVAHHGGLNGIDIYLSPAADAQATLVLHLRASPNSQTDILTASVSLSPGSAEGFYRFSFAPIRSSHTKYYYAYLEQEGTTQIGAPTGSLDAYRDGTLYYDHEPQELQTVFRLTYDSMSIVVDLVHMVAGWLAYGLAALVILFFSGYWLVRRWARHADLDFTATLISSCLAALAAWMAFLAWAGLLLSLEATTVRLVVGASASLGLVQFIRDRSRWWNKKYWLGPHPPATLALWMIVILSIALRLFVGRGMVVLPGSDTYHHTLIVQLFEEQGGIPHSYAPYAPLTSFSYHFGFHSIVALFRWLFGTELLVSTKTVALVLNGAVAATAALAAERWAGNRRAGVIAAAIVGLIAASPFALLSWGRFTQTTGLFFLAAALLAVIVVWERADWIFPSLLIAGLIFSHYRAAALFVLYVALAGAMTILQRRWNKTRDLAVLGIISAALAAPWIVRVAWVSYDPFGLTPSLHILEGVSDLQRLGSPVLSFVTNWPLLIASGLCAILVWLKKPTDNLSRVLVIWCLALAGRVLITPPFGLLTSLSDRITVLLSLAVPIGILAGLGCDWLWSAFAHRRRRPARAAIFVALFSAMTVGLLNLPRLLTEESSACVGPADLETMDWIEQNIPKDALFLVDTLDFDWAPGWVVGSDAGGWIPLLAHRATTVPPMIYSVEWGDPPVLTANLEASQAFLASKTRGTPALEEILDRYPITHIYAQHQLPLLADLAKERRLRSIYRQDRSWVFEVIR